MFSPETYLIAGFILGAGVASLANYISTNWYRRWYLICRNVLEEIEQTSRDEYVSGRARAVLQYIGPRTSKREDWEDWEDGQR